MQACWVRNRGWQPRGAWAPVAALILVLGLSACQTAPKPTAVVLTPVDAAVPPDVPAAAVTPRQGDELAHALLPLEKIVAVLPVPDDLPLAGPTTAPAGTSAANPEPTPAPTAASPTPSAIPLEAQRAYAQGRSAWLAGQTAQAVNDLNIALTAAPNQPEILALLGRIHLTTLNNRARGTVYLEQALRGDPTDAEALFLLARSEWEQMHWDRAIVLLAHTINLLQPPSVAVGAPAATQAVPDDEGDADESAPAAGPGDPGMLVLARHLLATVLERQGYDAAAAELYRLNLTQQAPFSRTSMFMRELMLLHRQQDQFWQNIGDIECRLGRYDAALDAYTRAQQLAAEDDDAPSPWTTTMRLAYVQLRRGDLAAAAGAVLTAVAADPKDNHAAQLVRYLQPYHIPAQLLTPELTRTYQTAGRPPALALALADLLPPVQAHTLLQEHLAQDPAAHQVLARLLQLDLARYTPAARAAAIQAGKTPPGVLGALQTTQAAITQTPAAAAAYAQALLDTLPADQWLAAVSTLPPEQQNTPALAYLTALAALQQNQPARAVAALTLALQGPPSIPDARIRLVQLLLDQRHLAQVRPYLDPVTAAEPDVALLNLKVRYLQATGHTQEALALVNTRLAQQPNAPTLLQTKAVVLLNQRLPNAMTEAERTLLQALEVAPLEEQTYTLLFLLYDQQGLPNADRSRVTLLRKALQTIPTARVTRLTLAREYLRTGEPGQAVPLLEALLRQQPRDFAALSLLLAALTRADRATDAQNLLDRHLQDDPRHPTLLLVARQYYQATHQEPRAAAMLEQWIQLQPAGPWRDARLAGLYLQTERPALAVDLLRKTLAALPAEPAAPATAPAAAAPDLDAAMDGEIALDDAGASTAGADDQRPIAVEALVSMLARALWLAHQPQDIDHAYQDALARHPVREAPLRLSWAMMLSRLQRTQDSETQLQRVLELSPRSDEAANALAYSWADRGAHLEQARKLVESALTQAPRNPAYLDTLGWVYYKLGRFDLAVQNLTQARLQLGGDHPVILNHLADALWRHGRTAEARQYWQVAQQAVTPEMSRDDPEVAHIAQAMAAKLEDVAAGRAPTLAPLGPAESPAPQNAIPATVPATAPAVEPAPAP